MIGIEKMPIKVLYRLAQAAGDTQLKRSDVLSLAAMSPYTSVQGAVGVDENGEPMFDPGVVAKKIGSAPSTIYKSFGALERAGYIEWQRAGSPVAPSVRIILPDHAQS